MLISYAQNREDVLLHRAFPKTDGFYVDVGAADPIEYSVTKWFYDRGWNGINLEPQLRYYTRILDNRPRDINLKLAVADKPGTLTLYEMIDYGGWATLQEDVAESARQSGIQLQPNKVPVLTLAEVCEKHADRPIDFMKIDVEGSERVALLGADFKRFRPKVLVIEATEQGKSTTNHQVWEDIVLAADYLYATFDGLNRYYVAAECKELVDVLAVPPNVFDQYVTYEHWALIQQSARLNEALAAMANCVSRETYDRLAWLLSEARAEANNLRHACLLRVAG